MPRYFFNIRDHIQDEDHEGIELGGSAEARVQAVIFAGDFLSDQPSLLTEHGRLEVEVRDEAGRRVVTITMSADKGDAGSQPG